VVRRTRHRIVGTWAEVRDVCLPDLDDRRERIEYVHFLAKSWDTDPTKV
jgi:hypothetical protein